MLLRREKHKKSYDPALLEPVIRKSICTGEMTAGFKDLKTGKFSDVMLIRGNEDIKAFMDEYGISKIPKTEYWPGGYDHG